MKAFVITTDEISQAGGQAAGRPASLLPLIDRPLVQHVIESLVNSGIKEIDIILCRFPEKFKNLLGDGRRWGARFRYHLVKNPSSPYRPVGPMTADKDRAPALLVHADRLLSIDVLKHRPPADADGPVLYLRSEFSEEGREKRSVWSGWAWISRKCRSGLADNLDEDGLRDYLMSFSDYKEIETMSSASVGVGSYADLLSANTAVLSKQKSGIVQYGREVEPGIWLSRNVQLHPRAELKAPIYIGENCSVGRSARLGPNVVVGRDCIVSSQTSISDAILFGNSYVGEGLELKGSMVDGNRLINVRIGSEMVIEEDFILSNLSEKRIQEGFKNILSRLAGSLLLLTTLPVFIGTALCLALSRGGKRVFDASESVCLPVRRHKASWRTFTLIRFSPAETNREVSDLQGERSPSIISPYQVGWRDLVLRFLPALVNVALGEIRLVGLAPRTTKEIQALPEEWRLVYTKGKAGIVSDALVSFGPQPSPDELYVSETLYVVSAGVINDVKILAKYFGQVLGLLPKP